jgi:anti-sigma regulatory factor (Ser/Thr protein kinase)
VNSRHTRRFTAKQAEFDAIRAFIENACACVDDEERQRAVLLVEELFANSVFHGYGGDSDEPVWLTVDVDEHGCRLVYEDRAPAYNPFLAEEPDLDAIAPEDRPIGGLGIVFLNELSTERSYARRGDRNVIEMHVRRSVHQ